MFLILLDFGWNISPHREAIVKLSLEIGCLNLMKFFVSQVGAMNDYILNSCRPNEFWYSINQGLITSNKSQIIKFLVEIGALPYLSKYNSPEILQILARFDYDLISWMFQKDPSLVHLRATNGMTLLHALVCSKADQNEQMRISSVIRFLISKGANVNNCMDSGWTPLAHAINSQNNYLAQVLLECGANPKDIINGKSLLQMSRGNSEVYQMLWSRGART
jgi:ankyrin repeat protein